MVNQLKSKNIKLSIPKVNTIRFPGSNNLLVVLTGETTYFVNSENIISPIELYKNLVSVLIQKISFRQLNFIKNLVSVQLLAALNIYLTRSAKDSKEVMSEFFHNLSLQALSIKMIEFI